MNASIRYNNFIKHFLVFTFLVMITAGMFLISDTSYSFADASGNGWTYNSTTKVLTINGQLDSFAESAKCPWWKSGVTKTAVNKVVFTEDAKASTAAVSAFNGCSNLTTVTGFNNFDLSDTKDITAMFQGCSSLTFVDVTNDNLCNVQELENMFKNCTKLTNVNGLKEIGSSVTNMVGMFYGCSILTSTAITFEENSFPNLTTTYQMYYGCTALKEVNMDYVSCPALTTTYQMYYGCKTLNKVSMRFAKFPKVTTTREMFCQADGTTSTTLKVADLTGSEWNILNTVDSMWIRNNGLTTIHYNYVKMPSVNNCGIFPPKVEEIYAYYADFSGIENLKNFVTRRTSLKYAYFNYANLSSISTFYEEDATYGFKNDAKLEVVDFTGANLSGAASLREMFMGLTNLKSASLSGAAITSADSISSMFNVCTSLKEVSLSNADISKAEAANLMFKGCTALEKVDFSGANTSNLNQLKRMFDGCTALTDLFFDEGALFSTLYAQAFLRNCSSLTSFDGKCFKGAAPLQLEQAFSGCKKLELLNLTYLNTSNINKMTASDSLTDGTHTMYNIFSSIGTESDYGTKLILGKDFVFPNTVTNAAGLGFGNNMYYGVDTNENQASDMMLIGFKCTADEGIGNIFSEENVVSKKDGYTLPRKDCGSNLELYQNTHAALGETTTYWPAVRFTYTTNSDKNDYDSILSDDKNYDNEAYFNPSGYTQYVYYKLGMKLQTPYSGDNITVPKDPIKFSGWYTTSSCTTPSTLFDGYHEYWLKDDTTDKEGITHQKIPARDAGKVLYAGYTDGLQISLDHNVKIKLTVENETLSTTDAVNFNSRLIGKDSNSNNTLNPVPTLIGLQTSGTAIIGETEVISTTFSGFTFSKAGDYHYLLSMDALDGYLCDSTTHDVSIIVEEISGTSGLELGITGFYVDGELLGKDEQGLYTGDIEFVNEYMGKSYSSLDALFVNVYNSTALTCKLEINKIVPGSSDTSESFRFTAISKEGFDDQGTTQCSFSLKNNERYVFSEIKKKDTITVYEDSYPGYETKYQLNGGNRVLSNVCTISAISADENTLCFYNNKLVQKNLTITKKISGLKTAEETNTVVNNLKVYYQTSDTGSAILLTGSAFTWDSDTSAERTGTYTLPYNIPSSSNVGVTVTEVVPDVQVMDYSLYPSEKCSPEGIRICQYDDDEVLTTFGALTTMSAVQDASVNLTNYYTYSKEPMVLDKTVSESTTSESQFTLNLESFSRGVTELIDSTSPADIVIAIDQSRSMLDPKDYVKGDIGSEENPNTSQAMYKLEKYKNSHFAATPDITEEQKAIIKKKATTFGYYCFQLDSNNKWYTVQYDSTDTSTPWYLYRGTDDTFNTTIEFANKITDEAFFGTSRHIYETRYSEMYDSLIACVDQLEDNNVGHRLALVGFSTNSNDGGTCIYNGSEKINIAYNNAGECTVDNPSQYLKLATDSAIRESIKLIKTEYGKTMMPAGFDLAHKILSDSERDSQKMAIVFTDGMVNRTLFDDKADSTLGKKLGPAQCVERAKRIKDLDNAKVYTVRTAALTGDDYNYIDYSSSDYPDATGTVDKSSEKASINIGENHTTGYSWIASKSINIKEIFKKIISYAGKTVVTLTEAAETRDYIQPEFVLPEGLTTAGIKVYTQSYLGNGSWAGKVPFENAAVGIDRVNNVVTVSGFNYSELYVHEATPDGTIPAGGQKLIIEIPINVSSSAIGKIETYTNTTNSGIYEDKDKDPGKYVHQYPVPSVELPAEVTVRKIVSGATSTGAFNMTWAGIVCVGYEDTTPNGKYEDTDRSNYLKATTSSSAGGFSLKHNGSTSLGAIKIGSALTIRENDVDGFCPIISVTDKDGNPYPDGSYSSIYPGEITILGLENNESAKGVTDGMVIKFTNMTGLELPSTGGSGTVLLMIAGALLVLMGGIGLVIRRRMQS